MTTASLVVVGVAATVSILLAASFAMERIDRRRGGVEPRRRPRDPKPLDRVDPPRVANGPETHLGG